MLITPKIFFFRNDLYVTLNNGEFERGGKSVGKNIEVLVLALDADGHPLQVIYMKTLFFSRESKLVIYKINVD